MGTCQEKREIARSRDRGKRIKRTAERKHQQKYNEKTGIADSPSPIYPLRLLAGTVIFGIVAVVVCRTDAEARDPGHWGTWITKSGWIYEGPLVDNHFDKDCISGLYRLTTPGGEVG